MRGLSSMGIILLLFSFLALSSLAETNVSILHGWNGTEFVPVQVDAAGRLKTTLNLSQSTGITPDSNNLRNIGSSILQWANGYFVNLFATGDLTVDTTTLYVSSSNDKVGIGTITPDNILTILGNELSASPLSALHINLTDSFNRSVVNAVTIDHVLKNPVNSTGGVGAGIIFRASNNASQMIVIANITAVLYNATNGTDMSALTFGTTNGTERMRIDGNGNVGIGTTAPNELLQIRNTSTSVAYDTYVGINAGLSSASGIKLRRYNSSYGFTLVADVLDGFNILRHYADTAGVSALYIAGSSGNVGIGTTTPDSDVKLDVNGNILSPSFWIASGAGDTLIGSGGGNIIVFNTSAAERMRIDNSGNVLVGKTTQGATIAGGEMRQGGVISTTASAVIPFYVNRLTDDGGLISFAQDSAEEGTISISGTTVSYNAFTGAHYGHLINVSSPKMGMVVVVDHSSIEYDGEDNQPEHYVALTTTQEDKRVMGILGANHSLSANDEGYDVDEFLIFALGDGIILVTDTNGNIENGNFLTTSSRAGYAQKQTSRQMMDYTVAKSLANVDWDEVAVDQALGFKWKLIPATYHAG